MVSGGTNSGLDGCCIANVGATAVRCGDGSNPLKPKSKANVVGWQGGPYLFCGKHKTHVSPAAAPSSSSASSVATPERSAPLVSAVSSPPASSARRSLGPSLQDTAGTSRGGRSGYTEASDGGQLEYDDDQVLQAALDDTEFKLLLQLLARRLGRMNFEGAKIQVEVTAITPRD